MSSGKKPFHFEFSLDSKNREKIARCVPFLRIYDAHILIHHLLPRKKKNLTHNCFCSIIWNSNPRKYSGINSLGNNALKSLNLKVSKDDMESYEEELVTKLDKLKKKLEILTKK